MDDAASSRLAMIPRHFKKDDTNFLFIEHNPYADIPAAIRFASKIRTPTGHHRFCYIFSDNEYAFFVDTPIIDHTSRYIYDICMENIRPYTLVNIVDFRKPTNAVAVGILMAMLTKAGRIDPTFDSFAEFHGIQRLIKDPSLLYNHIITIQTGINAFPLKTGDFDVDHMLRRSLEVVTRFNLAENRLINLCQIHFMGISPNVHHTMLRTGDKS